MPVSPCLCKKDLIITVFNDKVFEKKSVKYLFKKLSSLSVRFCRRFLFRIGQIN